MSVSPCIVWFRQDLRLTDNPALRAAARRGGPVIPVYIWAPQEEGVWAPGAASRWWLHESLTSLSADLSKAGSRLVICSGSSLEQLRRLIEETGAGAVHWNRRYEPAAIERDREIKKALAGAGVEASSFRAQLLFEPWEVETGSGGPYKVFTPFWKACLSRPDPDEPVRRPRLDPPPGSAPAGLAVESLGLLPKIDWSAGLRKKWRPGERNARARLRRFVDRGLPTYELDRDKPALPGTSGLSPHLHFGEIGPRGVWHAVRRAEAASDAIGMARGAETFLAELGWREFAHHLLFHFPETTEQPLRDTFRGFPWRSDKKGLRAWQRGRTGYPLVDAGMRELWATGTMHNRVRMVAASFLTKDLLVPWQRGAEWFWDTLVDADLASNTLGWQWTAGCGADAAPFFRIFNPVTQGVKFDPGGEYVRTWVPELRKLPDRFVHAPWEAPDQVLAGAEVRIGRDYPQRIVDHGLARRRALDAYERVRSA